jgi:ubiquinone/menaquinone biosynthesis C-methylase UbiE
VKITEGLQFIQNVISQSENPQIWADLGCGAGLFTIALAELLPKGSKIYAVDKVSQFFPSHTEKGVYIQFIKADIENVELDLPKLDGIIMANVLHYVKHQSKMIIGLEKYFEEEKQFILIEYDHSISNQWVPYPIPFSALNKLFPVDTYHIQKIHERPSIYGQGNMYSAFITTKSKNHDTKNY